MSVIIYQIGLFLYQILIRIAKFFGNTKAKLFIDGRNYWQSLLYNKTKYLNSNKRIWIHCASLGEFEQGRPIIELLKKDLPEVNIILSFFSPSGYEIRKNYEHADIVTYLPMDSRTNATAFIEIIKPDLVVFVKYEFWYFYLNEIAKRNIPSILIAAVFKPNQIFFKSYGSLHRKILRNYKQVFVQNEESKQLLQKLNVPSIDCGDPRIDRALAIPLSAKQYEKVLFFANNQPLIIAGSTWKDDEDLLVKAMKILPQNYKLLIVPHEVDQSHIDHLFNQFKEQNTVLWDKDKNTLQNARVAVVNVVGHLSSLYQYATFVWIGGGFNKSGIHNTLEPAAFGKPIAFGPNYKKFPEADYWVKKANGLATDNEHDFANWVIKLNNNYNLQEDISKKIVEFLNQSSGASVIIFNYIKSLIFGV